VTRRVRSPGAEPCPPDLLASDGVDRRPGWAREHPAAWRAALAFADAGPEAHGLWRAYRDLAPEDAPSTRLGLASTVQWARQFPLPTSWPAEHVRIDPWNPAHHRRR
jgi:hypothetical protein